MSLRTIHPRSPRMHPAHTLGLIARMRATRAARNDHATLTRELSEFRSPADLLELSAILDRYPESQTGQVRRAINWHPTS